MLHTTILGRSLAEVRGQRRDDEAAATVQALQSEAPYAPPTRADKIIAFAEQRGETAGKSCKEGIGVAMAIRSGTEIGRLRGEIRSLCDELAQYDTPKEGLQWFNVSVETCIGETRGVVLDCAYAYDDSDLVFMAAYLNGIDILPLIQKDPEHLFSLTEDLRTEVDLHNRRVNDDAAID